MSPATRFPSAAAAIGLTLGFLVLGVAPIAAQDASATITASATVLPPVQSRVLQVAVGRAANEVEADHPEGILTYIDVRDGAQVSVSTGVLLDRRVGRPATRQITIAFTGI